MAKQAHTDDQFLHTVANILMRDIHNLDIKNDFYPTPSECSLSNSIPSMPPTLTKFICCLIDEKSFSAVNIQKEMSEEKMWKYMSLSECIVSLCKSVITPFQIGLALQLYHEFGSKQLIETLHTHGFCSSYDEVRRYLTSLANHEIDLEPILFEGQMSSDFLQDLICTCKGRSVCSKGCVCFEHNFSCTELCPCQALDLCHNVITHRRSKMTMRKHARVLFLNKS